MPTPQRNPIKIPDNPGANSAVLLYDDFRDHDPGQPLQKRVRIMAYLNQNFSLNTFWAADSSSPLRLLRSDSYTGGAGGHVLGVKAALPITVVAKASLAVMAPASLPITVVAKASLANNDYFTVTHTVGAVTVETVFEYKVDGDFVATPGRVTIDVSGATTDVSVAVITAAAVAADVDLGPLVTVAVPSTATFTVTDKVAGSAHAITATENVANAGFLIGSPTVGVDSDYFSATLTITRNGVADATTVTFEYKVVSAGFVATPGRTVIDVTEASSANDVAIATATAIATAFSTTLDVPAPGAAIVTMTNKSSGVAYAISASEHVANAGFAVGSPTAGVDGTIVDYNYELRPGRSAIYLQTGTAPTEFEVRVETRDDVNPGA